MNDQENQSLICSESESFDFDELERKLEENLKEQFTDFELLEKERDNIGNPDTLGNAVLNVVWDQFINQIGVVAGEDFIKENSGMKLDLRNDAHIQTTENFAEGKIASHNTQIDYQQKYDEWQSNFEKDKNGDVITHINRTGREEKTLVKGARARYDESRPHGSKERRTQMDHTISAAEIIRDPGANAHMTERERIEFANSEINLNEIDQSLNQSKSDLSTTEWLDTPNANGQRPCEIFEISSEQDAQLRQKDAEAREEYEKLKKDGKAKSIEVGKQSQKAEAFRIGGKALRAAIIGLLAELVRNIIAKLIIWIKSGKKNFEEFIVQMKRALHDFIFNLKQNLLTAGNTLVTSIATAIVGPVVATIKKVWILIKQCGKSVKEAIQYIRNPENRNKAFSVKLLEIGKIITIGLTAGGAIVLGDVIEKGLLAIPGFAVEIPLIGSLANVLGIFFSGVVCGIAGALVLNLIDNIIARKEKEKITELRIDKGNEILSTQEKLLNVEYENLQFKKTDAYEKIMNRRNEASEELKEMVKNIVGIDEKDDNVTSSNKARLDAILDKLERI